MTTTVLILRVTSAKSRCWAALACSMCGGTTSLAYVMQDAQQRCFRCKDREEKKLNG